jgi:hypothetical protein
LVTIFLSLPFALQTQFTCIVMLQLTVEGHCFVFIWGNCIGPHAIGAFCAQA